MRLCDAFGRSKGAVNLVWVSTVEELVEEFTIGSFIRLLCGIGDCLGQLLRRFALSKSVRNAKYVVCANK